MPYFIRASPQTQEIGNIAPLYGKGTKCSKIFGFTQRGRAGYAEGLDSWRIQVKKYVSDCFSKNTANFKVHTFIFT